VSTVNKENKHLVGCVARLAWKCLFTPTFLMGNFYPWIRSDRSSFSVRWGSISRSVCARLQVSVCSGYDLCHHDWPTDR